MATLLERANLVQDADFIKRCSQAVVKFAVYILNETPAAANHKARHRWASAAILNPMATASAIAPAVTLEASVDYGLGAVTDGDLQIAVESVCSLLQFN